MISPNYILCPWMTMVMKYAPEVNDHILAGGWNADGVGGA
jgi:hypothetical protein